MATLLGLTTDEIQAMCDQLPPDDERRAQLLEVVRKLDEMERDMVEISKFAIVVASVKNDLFMRRRWQPSAPGTDMFHLYSIAQRERWQP